MNNFLRFIAKCYIILEGCDCVSRFVLNSDLLQIIKSIYILVWSIITISP